MKKLIAASSILCLLLLVACSTFIKSSPTAIPTLTFTAVPMLLPLTGTHDAISGLVPEGQPASEWNGIPIMPDAIAGDGDQESYVFTVKATPQQVREYYELELGKLGWQPVASGDEESSLMFMNGASEVLTISIVTKGDTALVILAK